MYTKSQVLFIWTNKWRSVFRHGDQNTAKIALTGESDLQQRQHPNEHRQMAVQCAQALAQNQQYRKGNKTTKVKTKTKPKGGSEVGLRSEKCGGTWGPHADQVMLGQSKADR